MPAADHPPSTPRRAELVRTLDDLRRADVGWHVLDKAVAVSLGHDVEWHGGAPYLRPLRFGRPFLPAVTSEVEHALRWLDCSYTLTAEGADGPHTIFVPSPEDPHRQLSETAATPALAACAALVRRALIRLEGANGAGDDEGDTP